MQAPPGSEPIGLVETLATEAVALGLLDPQSPRPTNEREVFAALAEANTTALCLSGGGIRSATFNLGVLQGLAKRRLLTHFHYLSTVSGGGYIGSWLTAAASRRANGVAEIESELRELAQPRTNDERTNDEPGAHERRRRAEATLDHLRRHSKYLSPNFSLLSPDTWALVSIYSRNLLLNWLVIVPLLAAALMVPRLLIAAEAWVATHGDQPLWGWSYRLWLGGAGVLLICWAFLRAVLDLPSNGKCTPGPDRDGTDSRAAQSRFLRWCLTPLLGGTLAVSLAFTWTARSTTPAELAELMIGWRYVGYGLAAGGLAGLLTGFRTARHYRNIWRGAVDFSLAASAGLVMGLTLWLFAAGFARLATAVAGDPTQPWWHLTYTCTSVPAVLLALSAGGTAYIGLGSRLPWTADAADQDREWWARFGGWILICVLVWSLTGAIVVLLPAALEQLWHHMPTGLVSSGSVLTIITAVLGYGADATGARATTGGPAKRSWRQLALSLAGPIVLLLLLSGLALATSAVLRAVGAAGRTHAEVLHNSPPSIALWLLAFAAAGLIAGLAVHLNQFSLHAIYRDRLIRAYLGAARLERRPQPFTGFDPCDNVYLHALRPTLRQPSEATGGPEADLARSRAIDATTKLARRSALREPPEQTSREGRCNIRPLHVINMALNLVRSDNRAWAERKADSFTATMFHVGNARLGYRDTAFYAGTDGLTLGTAMSISGAAVSPNMGYQSQPLLAFLLTLFNVRLGAWFGNPGQAGGNAHLRQAPPFGVLTLLWEALGRTTDRQSYVYLSDGGHFENLGLYEMVRRRCRTIVVSDAGQDPDYALEDLGNAVRKVRIDLGIHIEFPRLPIALEPGTLEKTATGKAAPRLPSQHFAVGRIDYAAVDGPLATPGVVLYLKASTTGDEPIDVADYARRFTSFPHETTANQFFTEAQFESYRALGEHVVDSLPDDPLQWAHSEVQAPPNSA